MSELVIRIKEDGAVSVEEHKDGVTAYKPIASDSLLACLNQSMLRGTVASGLLPRNCLSFTAHDNGEKDVTLLHTESHADISYFDTEYKSFPLPKLVFGFRLTSEGRVGHCRLGVVDNTSNLKPATPMFTYPLSNVSGFSLCTGNNILPKCDSLHTLSSVPYYILAMPNNNDHYSAKNNKPGFEMRGLLELLKDKPPEYYYSDILVPNRLTLADFINAGG